MEKIIFECETITPMFLSGADGKTPELRAPSIKAAMRFWWRALNSDKSIPDLREAESKIFGGSGENEGKSKLQIKITEKNFDVSNNLFKRFPTKPIHKENGKGKKFDISILDYLTFGPCTYNKDKKRNEFIRNYITQGSKFNIVIKYDSTFIKQNEIEFLLFLVSEIGGIGTKSRNGFGRFKITNYGKLIINSFDDFKDKIVNSKEISDYTSFSKYIKIYKLRNNEPIKTWEECLATLGEIYIRSREAIENKYVFQKRLCIAAPIELKGRRIEIEMKNEEHNFKLERHPKTYFLIPFRTNNIFEGYIIYFPYKFLSMHEKIIKEDIDKSGQKIKIDLSREIYSKYTKANEDFNIQLANRMEVVKL